MTNGDALPRGVNIEYNADGTVTAIADEVISFKGGSAYFKNFKITKNGVVKTGFSSPYTFTLDADTHITAIYTAYPM